MTIIRASWISPKAWYNWPMMALAERSGLRRFSKSSSVMKAMPELGLAVNPLGERPGNATEAATPGTFMAKSLMRRMTASVRSSEAASGNWATQMRNCLSCDGMKPAGTAWKTRPVRKIKPT